MFPLDVLANGGFAQDRRRVPIVGVLCEKYRQVRRIIEPSLNSPGDCIVFHNRPKTQISLVSAKPLKSS